MKSSKKTHNILSQNDQKGITSQKNEVNLRKNTILYFQLGLILTLLATYALFEMQFENKIIAIEHVTPPNDNNIYAFNENITIEKDKKKNDQKVEPQKRIITNPVIIEDDHIEEVTAKIINEESLKGRPDINIDDISVISVPEEPYNIIGVEQVPIFPGCEKLKTNKETRDCFSTKVNKLINKNFNIDRVANKGIAGRHRVNVGFTINREGEVVNIKTSAKHEILNQEALKTIKTLPKMIPAKQSNKTVSVVYSLPIIIVIQE